MIRFIRTDSTNNDFQKLVSELDEYLAIIDGKDHGFYAQYNKIDALKFAVVAYENDLPVGCGAIKYYDHQAMEVKRMYVLPDHRGKGVAAAILKNLENWCSELGFHKCILETGRKQPDAIALYQKSGYLLIPNYGQYIGVDNSVCFEKDLLK